MTLVPSLVHIDNQRNMEDNKDVDDQGNVKENKDKGDHGNTKENKDLNHKDKK
ncbi:MAG: hypothetical protein ACXVHR_09595 [Methanobacterium sp.]